MLKKLLKGLLLIILFYSNVGATEEAEDSQTSRMPGEWYYKNKVIWPALRFRRRLLPQPLISTD